MLIAGARCAVGAASMGLTGAGQRPPLTPGKPPSERGLWERTIAMNHRHFTFAIAASALVLGLAAPAKAQTDQIGRAHV